MERLRDEQLTRFRPVSIGRVDQVHPKFNCAAQNLERIVSVGRPSQIPSPVMRIAPNPSRLTGRSPPNFQETFVAWPALPMGRLRKSWPILPPIRWLRRRDSCQEMFGG